jgi:hypothetical protein
MTLIARCTPVSFHRFINQLRGRRPTNTFPTHYRINSPSAVRRCAALAGLEVVATELIEGRPEYLRFCAFTYLFGYLYERLVNSTRILAGLRIVLLIELRKPSAA